MKLLFATTNPHKFDEMSALLAELPLSLVSLTDLDVEIPEPAEDEQTLSENARIKALAYAMASGLPCLADDSGLEVDALGGAPGVHSARYAGASGSREVRDQKNREKLLGELARLGPVDRTARLVCTLCFAEPTSTLGPRVLFEGRGVCAAEIIHEPRGEHGFGYDVLLYLKDAGRTAAELAPAEWNRHSHRAAAARAFMDWFRSQSPTPAPGG